MADIERTPSGAARPDGPELPGGPDAATGQTGQTGNSGASNGPAEALARVRAVARAKGLRPGMKPRRRARAETGDRSGKTGRDPVLIAEQIEHLVADREWENEIAIGGVIGRWTQIVGPEVAQHCRPTDFTDGVLTVRADSTAWATQLRLLSSTVLTQLEREVGSGIVGELRVVGPSAPSWSKGALRASGGRGPRDTYG